MAQRTKRTSLAMDVGKSILIEGPLLCFSRGNVAVDSNLLRYRRWKGGRSYQRYFTLDEDNLKYYNISAQNTVVGSRRRMSSMMTKRLGGQIKIDSKIVSVALTGKIGEFVIKREAQSILLRAPNDIIAKKWIIELQKVAGIDPDLGLMVGHDSSSSDEEIEADGDEEDQFDTTFDRDSDDEEQQKLRQEHFGGSGWSRGSTAITLPGLEGLFQTSSRQSMGMGGQKARPSILGFVESEFGDEDAANQEIDSDNIDAHGEMKVYGEVVEERKEQEAEEAAEAKLTELAIDKIFAQGGDPEPKAIESILAGWQKKYGNYAEALEAASELTATDEMLAGGATPADVRAKAGIEGAGAGASTDGSSAAGSICDGLLAAYGETTGTTFTQGVDAKDTGDFTYVRFDECPKFTDEHKSAMAKHLTPELWSKLKDAKTSKGYTLSNAVQTGCLLPHLGVGCTAGDEESWEVFKDLYYPVIQDWHGYDANTQKHPTDLDASKLVFSDAQKAKFEEYVASTRIRAARNISGYSLPCGATDEERAGVEDVVSGALTSITDADLKGTYYKLGEMTDEQRDFLLSKGYLFQIPTARNLLMGAGAARSWPDNRGIFHNDNQTALAWCNEEDHCRIISMKMGGDIPDVFARFGNLSKALEATGAKLMWNETLGYMGTCPSNLGTGLRASVMIQLKCFNAILEDPSSSHEDKELLEQVCSQFDLQPRGSAGEHSPAKDAKFDVSNKQRLGFSEVELVQKMIDGVTKLIELEEMLAGGATPADVRAKAGIEGAGTGASTDGSSAAGSICDGLLAAYGETTGTTFTQGVDAKDTGDFTYVRFDECPKFTDEHKSAMAKHLTPELWSKLKDAKTSKGYTLSNAVQTGCLLPHLGVGCTAGDEESWEVFKDLYYPVIQDWHGYDANTQKHPTDLDASKLVFSDAQKAKFEEYVASTRIRAARNISGYSLPCGATDEERAGVEDVVSGALTSITDADLKGTYYKLGEMTDEQRDFLLSKGYLFQIPTARNLLMGAGAARSWPDNRGIFHNDNQTALAWCNEEDHCRIISMKMGGDIPDVFARFGNLSKALEATGAKLMWNETLGYMGTCPSNLGTGLRASVMIQLKCFNAILEDPSSSHEDKELLEQVCSQFDLQPRGSAGEHSPAKDAKFDVSNKQRLGFSEVELVQKMIDGVTKLIELEEMLAGGATPADVRAKAGIEGAGAGASTDGSSAAGSICDGLLAAYGETTGTTFTQGVDAKDTGDFTYVRFDECPKFTDEHKSAMAKHLTPELWSKLKDAKTSKGYTLSNAVQTGCLLPHLGVGCTAGDEESWEVFKDLYYPVIQDWHGYDANTQKHPTDLDASKLVFSDAQKAKFEEYVASTRIRAARNISGYSLPCGATDEERAGVEDVVSGALTSITDADLKGTYYKLGEMTDEQRDFLLSKGYLFQIPTARNLLMGAGAARSWPDNRGIFHNDNQTALAWCNEEDHCRIISMKMGGDIPDVFARFGNLSKALEATGAKLMWNETLGYMGTCPSNLGTGLRASVMIQLKCFNAILEDPSSSHEDKELLEQVCSQFDLQPRGSAGEHSPAKDAKFDVSNKQRLGFSEVELVQKMIDGVTKLIELEEMLAGGATPADVRAKAGIGAV